MEIFTRFEIINISENKINLDKLKNLFIEGIINI